MYSILDGNINKQLLFLSQLADGKEKSTRSDKKALDGDTVPTEKKEGSLIQNETLIQVVMVSHEGNLGKASLIRISTGNSQEVYSSAQDMKLEDYTYRSRYR